MNIVEPLHAHAKTAPHATALVLPQGRLRWSELSALIHASAAFLRGQGLAPGERVGVRIDSPIAHLLCAFGLAQIGVAHVAVSAKDTPAQRQALAGHLALDAIVAAGGADGAGDATRVIVMDSPAALARRSPTAPQPVWQDPLCTWLILQSSGTTGAPKFAALSHADAMARSARFLPLYACGPADVFWAMSRLDFVVAKQRVVHALHAGAAVCLPHRAPFGGRLFDFLRASGVTLACGTPSHLAQLLAARGQAGALPSLRAVEVRSATVSEPLRRRFRQAFCEGLHVVYATNEGEALTIAPPALQDALPDTVGRATGAIELAIVDASGRPLPAGEVGEVRVRGPGVVSSYIGNPEASERSFRDGWFHPGDLATLTADGQVVLKGRKDDMMIFDGMNIYPAEIETVLLAHPAVSEAAAYPITHERLQDVPAASVVLQAPATEAELMRHCKERLGVKAPVAIGIVDDFPRNAMGKILKRELAADSAIARRTLPP